MTEIVVKEEILDEKYYPVEEEEGSTVLSWNENVPNNNCQIKVEENRTLPTQGLVPPIHAPEAVWIKEEPESDQDTGRIIDADTLEGKVKVKDELETDDGNWTQSVDSFASSNNKGAGREQQPDGTSKIKAELPPEGGQAMIDFINHAIMALSPKKDPSPRPDRFPCTLCDKVFRKNHLLKYHIMTHTGERPFQCAACGHKFRRRCELKIHSTVHTGIRPYKCEQCECTFPQQDSLTRHLLVHSGKPPFLCPHCPKKFSDSEHYNAHVRTHSGVRPFACNQCEKTFVHCSSLTAHLRLHKGDQPYGCDQCGKRYSQRRSLITHLRLHTGERPFACEKCGKTFAAKCGYKKHVQSHLRLKRPTAPRGKEPEKHVK